MESPNWDPPLPPNHWPGREKQPPLVTPKASGEPGNSAGGPTWFPPEKPYAANGDEEQKKEKNPEAKKADDRAKELESQMGLHPPARGAVTVGVEIGIDEEGNERKLVSINEGGWKPDREAKLKELMGPDEEWANGPNSGQKLHAEEILIQYKNEHNLVVRGIGASRPFCGPSNHDCQGQLLQEVGEAAMGQD